MPFRGQAGRQGQAFTLIELLVVVAIIALLISILLPSLQGAREQSKAMVCKTRLLQLYHGHNYYAYENKGIFPHWGWWLYDGFGHDGGKPYFLRIKDIYRTTGGRRSADSRLWVQYGDIYRYVRDQEAYFCPSDNKARRGASIGSGGSQGNYPITSFVRILEPHQFIQNKIRPISVKSQVLLPGDFINPDKLRRGAFKFDAMPEVATFLSIPSRVGMMYEEDQGWGDIPYPNSDTLNDGHSSTVLYGNDFMSPRHSRRRGHLLYWDGRAELCAADRWNAYPADSYVVYMALGAGKAPPKP